MTEQTSEEVNVPIAPERLLAAILKNTNEIEIPVEDLLADYTDLEISVSQERDDYVIFSLIKREDNAS
jgi:hypothetical protein